MATILLNNNNNNQNSVKQTKKKKSINRGSRHIRTNTSNMEEEI